jgi:predicted nuclease with RNAse H fold
MVDFELWKQYGDISQFHRAHEVVREWELDGEEMVELAFEDGDTASFFKVKYDNWQEEERLASAMINDYLEKNSMTASKLTPIGIDPASGKKSFIWSNSGPDKPVAAGEMRAKIQDLIGSPCFIAWDAPLSYSSLSFTDRLIDKATRQWVKEMVKAGRFEKKAINAMPFSGLSHWVISREALGLPNRNGEGRLALYPEVKYSKKPTLSAVGEVHPAVALGCLWLDKGIKEPFPRYKGVKKSVGLAARKSIVKALRSPDLFPDSCVESDDVLDAYVAWLMAKQFLDGKAEFANDPMEGSYILPKGGSLKKLRMKIDTARGSFG